MNELNKNGPIYTLAKITYVKEIDFNYQPVISENTINRGKMMKKEDLEDLNMSKITKLSIEEEYAPNEISFVTND